MGLYNKLENFAQNVESTQYYLPTGFATGTRILADDVNASLNNATIGSYVFYEILDRAITSGKLRNEGDTVKFVIQKTMDDTGLENCITAVTAAIDAYIKNTKSASASAADAATNVTTKINGKNITSIFESNGTTAKEATKIKNKLGNYVELKSALLDMVYPVGSIYISTNNVSPATFLGGKWSSISGKFLLAKDTSHAAGSTGGSYTQSLSVSNLPSHTHTFSGTTANDGNHAHYGIGLDGLRDKLCFGNDTGVMQGYKLTATGPASGGLIDTASGGIHNHTFSGTTGSTGSGSSFSITPPYLAVYMWQRLPD